MKKSESRAEVENHVNQTMRAKMKINGRKRMGEINFELSCLEDETVEGYICIKDNVYILKYISQDIIDLLATVSDHPLPKNNLFQNVNDIPSRQERLRSFRVKIELLSYVERGANEKVEKTLQLFNDYDIRRDNILNSYNKKIEKADEWIHAELVSFHAEGDHS